MTSSIDDAESAQVSPWQFAVSEDDILGTPIRYGEGFQVLVEERRTVTQCGEERFCIHVLHMAFFEFRQIQVPKRG